MAQGEWTTTTRLIDRALEILEEENPMTIRQLFYRLVSVEEIQNTQLDYQRVSRLMTKARRDDRCPYEYIVDRSRPISARELLDGQIHDGTPPTSGQRFRA